ncbi:MAG: arginine--tRNA ligase [Candidatus Firestonebacteria bacterium]
MGDIPEISFEVPKHKSFGDLSTNFAMALAGQEKKNPREAAKLIIENLEFDKTAVSKIEIAGPGFINFFLSEGHLFDVMLKVDGNPDFAAISGGGKKINIEFVSANPVGPLNVVNARAAAVGNCLANLLKNAGFSVIKEFYINDVGNQTNIFGKSINLRYEELFGKKIVFPEDCYAGEYVKEIADRIKLEDGDKYLAFPEEQRVFIFKQKGLAWMVLDQGKSLSSYGVEFDLWYPERLLHAPEEKKLPDLPILKRYPVNNKVKEAAAILAEKGLLKEEDGAVWFMSTAVNAGDDKDRVLIKKDGELTYLSADIAYHKEKFDRADKLINIWGPDHHGYIPRMRAALVALGHKPEDFSVLIAQQVNLIKNGQPFKMSKRKGSFITMDELVEEVGPDAAKYFFIRRSLESHLDFDIDLAKKQSDENPVFYVQYAHARICNVIEFAKTSGVALKPAKEVDLPLLKEPEELDILKKINTLSDTLEYAALNYEPHHLPKFLEELAGLYHSFYAKHRVVTENKPLSEARLVLCSVVRKVLKKGLDLLGVSAPTKM